MTVFTMKNLTKAYTIEVGKYVKQRYALSMINNFPYNYLVFSSSLDKGILQVYDLQSNKEYR